ncbi:MAG: sensor histidine kinase [Bacteroidales bacterium]|nr:sensor histidine kinase [Bacteroidales bacterium]MCF8406159.1 sensor histidine kinase [Bacteroidales bacterium]
MRALLLILLFFNSVFLLAEEKNELDSLLHQNEVLDGEAKIKNLVNLCRYYFILGDSLSLMYGNQAIALSNQLGYEIGVGQASFFIACYWDGIDVEKALEYYEASKVVFEKFDHPWVGYSYNNLSRIYRERGWYPEALEIAIKSLKIFEAQADSNQIATELTLIGYIYNRMGDHRESLKWHRKALNIPHMYVDSATIGIIYGRIGIVYDELAIYDSAYYYNSIAISYFKAIKDYTFLSLWYSNIGNTLLKENRLTKAEEYFNEALKINEKGVDQSIVLINLGNVYTKTGRYTEAKEILDKAIDNCLKNGQASYLSEAYFRKYELAEKLGDKSMALNYFQLYNNINDSILNTEKTNQIAQMRVRYETDQKERQILIEKAEKEQIAKEKALAEVKLYNRNIWIIVIGSISLIIIFFSLYLIQRNRRRTQAEKDAAIILEQEKGIKAVITAQEDERKRIAKDLHDGIGQQLSGLKMGWANLLGDIINKLPDEKDRLNKLSKVLDEAASDVRSISHQMMPRVLSESGLIPAIEDMLEKSLGTTAIKYEFETYRIEGRFKENIEISIFRVLQELINNIIKHAGAMFVNIQLFTNKGYLILMVEDNGRGFNADTNSEGHGLLNIKSRINAINGEVSYDPSPGSGTVATVRVPLT